MRSNGDTRHDLEPELEHTIQEIARSRQRLSASLGALKQEVRSLADWEEWVRRRPWQFLGGAFLLGLWLGSRGRR
jgi:ElaB/YqjD/DUF883 family membrane-anchored ribosome-binding protein